MVRHSHAAIGEGLGREITIIARKTILNGKAEQGLIARGGDLIGIRQTRRILVDRTRHAERAGLPGHQPGEFLFRSGEMLGDHDRRVIGGFGHQRLDRILDHQRLTGAHPELGRRLDRGMSRHFHLRIEPGPSGFQPLEQQIERHDLGERGGMALRIRLGRMQHVAGIGIDDDVCITRLVRGRALRNPLEDFPFAACIRGACEQSDEGYSRRQSDNAATQAKRGLGRYAEHGQPSPFAWALAAPFAVPHAVPRGPARAAGRRINHSQSG